MTLTRRARAAVAVFLAAVVLASALWFVAATPLATNDVIVAQIVLVLYFACVAWWITADGARTPGELADALWARGVVIVLGMVVWGIGASLVIGTVRPLLVAGAWVAVSASALLATRWARNSESLRNGYYRALKKALGSKAPRKRKRSGLSTAADFERAARRGFVTAALARLEQVASAAPDVDRNGRETSMSQRRRVQALVYKAFVLDQQGRFAEADVEARRAYELDRKLVNLRDRSGARIVSMFARAGDDASAVKVIRESEKQGGFYPRLDVQRLAADETQMTGAERLAILNEVYLRAGLPPVTLADPSKPVTMSNLRGVVTEADWITEGPVMTIAVPCFNSADSIDFVMETVLTQTYRPIEVIVVDDASTDDTSARVEEWCARDPRVRLLRNEKNSGAYVSRNRALAAATGKYFMVRDADDWAHPCQVEVLVRGMQENGDRHGAIVDHVRASSTLVSRGPVTNSTASLTVDVEFARSLGGWHEVRIGADSEFIERCRRVAGKNFVVTQHPWVPIALAFVGDTNLTTDGPRAVRYVRHVAGVRALYHEAAERYRRSKEFDGTPGPARPATARRFVVPRLMDPLKHGKTGVSRLDVVYVADLSCNDDRGTLADAELEALASTGLRIGVLNQPRFPENAIDEMRSAVWEHIDGERVRCITVGEEIAAGLLWVSDIRSGAYLTDELPRISAKRALVGVDAAVAALPPIESAPYSDVAQNLANLSRAFSTTFTIAPRGPRARALLGDESHEEAVRAAIGASDVPARVASVVKSRVQDEATHVAIADSHGVFIVPAHSSWRRLAGRAGAAMPGVKASRGAISWKTWYANPRERNKLLARAAVVDVHRSVRRSHLKARVITDAALAGVPVVADKIGESILGDGYSRADSATSARRAVRELVADRDLRAQRVARANEVLAARMAPGLLLRALGLEPSEKSAEARLADA